VRLPSRSRFSLFIALSLAIHAIALTELPALTAPSESRTSMLTAELVRIAPPKPPDKPPAVRAKPVVAQKPRSSPPQALPPSSPATPERSPITAPPSEWVTEPEGAAPESIAESAVAGETQPEAPPLAQAEQASGTPDPVFSAATPAILPVRDLPQTGSINYELFMGKSRLHIGRTSQTWEISERRYRLSSASETTGLAGLFRPYQLDYVSEGRVDATGFQPESFLVRRGRNGSRQYAVRFDWSSKQLTLGPTAAPRKVALPPGTLDILSFIYQLVRSQLAPGRFQLYITTGSRLDIHSFDIGPEEDVEVPIGTIRTVPVRQVRIPGQESIEVWLAPERRYLPVRVRFLDRNGELSGEQLAADIAFDVK
jgi:hypothetical protein